MMNIRPKITSLTPKKTTPPATQKTQAKSAPTDNQNSLAQFFKSADTNNDNLVGWREFDTALEKSGIKVDESNPLGYLKKNYGKDLILSDGTGQLLAKRLTSLDGDPSKMSIEDAARFIKIKEMYDSPEVTKYLETIGINADTDFNANPDAEIKALEKVAPNSVVAKWLLDYIKQPVSQKDKPIPMNVSGAVEVRLNSLEQSSGSQATDLRETLIPGVSNDPKATRTLTKSEWQSLYTQLKNSSNPKDSAQGKYIEAFFKDIFTRRPNMKIKLTKQDLDKAFTGSNILYTVGNIQNHLAIGAMYPRMKEDANGQLVPDGDQSLSFLLKVAMDNADPGKTGRYIGMETSVLSPIVTKMRTDLGKSLFKVSGPAV